MNEWTTAQTAARPVEARIVRKIVRAMKAAGTPWAICWDGEQKYAVGTEAEIMDAVFSVDEPYLFTEDGCWIRFAMGEGWEIVADYAAGLEDTLAPVFAYIDEHMD